jgi:hypothetical protein
MGEGGVRREGRREGRGKERARDGERGKRGSEEKVLHKIITILRVSAIKS